LLLKQKNLFQMDNEQKNGNKEAGQQQNSEVRGRTHGSQNEELEQKGGSHDISQVDQQEGNMNNGESGGNFSTENKDE
jgi:hypothetical protein